MAFVNFLKLTWPDQATELLRVSVRDLQRFRGSLWPRTRSPKLSTAASPNCRVSTNTIFLCVSNSYNHDVGLGAQTPRLGLVEGGMTFCLTAQFDDVRGMPGAGPLGGKGDHRRQRQGRSGRCTRVSRPAPGRRRRSSNEQIAAFGNIPDRGVEGVEIDEPWSTWHRSLPVVGKWRASQSVNRVACSPERSREFGSGILTDWLSLLRLWSFARRKVDRFASLFSGTRARLAVDAYRPAFFSTEFLGPQIRSTDGLLGGVLRLLQRSR